MRSLLLPFVCASLVPVLSGCRSMSATYLGSPEQAGEVDGMPVVLERPRYMKVTVRDVQRQLVAMSTAKVAVAGDASGVGGGLPPLPGNPPAGTASAGANTSIAASQISFGNVLTGRVVEYETITVGEVYALDVKRPAAGTSEFEIEFAEGAQYPSKLKSKSEDKTMAEIRDTLAKIAEGIVKGATPTSGKLNDGDSDGQLIARAVEINSQVVSVHIYDLDQVSNPAYQPRRVYP